MMASSDPLHGPVGIEPALSVGRDANCPTEPDQQPVGTVVVDRRILCWLTMAALNDICAADEDGGCCPVCCAPCAAVKALLDAGQLDDVLREQGRAWDWWDSANDRVDRALLERAWRLTSCHEEAV